MEAASVFLLLFIGDLAAIMEKVFVTTLDDASFFFLGIGRERIYHCRALQQTDDISICIVSADDPTYYM